jgi:hypothetical protein
VLALVGHLDRLTIPEASGYISEHVPRGQFTKLVPGGHMALLERHEQMTHLIGQFTLACTLPADQHPHATNHLAD